MLFTAILVLFLCFLSISSQTNNLYTKCCAPDFEFNEQNICVNQTNTRLDVLSSEYYFPDRVPDYGNCIESNGRDFYLYNIKNGTLNKTKIDKSIVKCCPLNHVYDNSTRGCKRTDSGLINQFFVKNKIQAIKIGLPQCKMITTTSLESFNNVNHRVQTMESGKFCLDQGVNNDTIIRECHEGLDLCEKKKCIKKCCPDGQSYVGGAFCKDTYIHGVNLTNRSYTNYIEDVNGDYELIYAMGCKKMGVVLNNSFQYSISKSGEFKYYKNISQNFIHEHYTNPYSYCLEHADKLTIKNYMLFLCTDRPMEKKFLYTMYGKIISVVCLVLTIAVYLFLSEWKNIFGKILLNYCVAMSFLLLSLLYTHLYPGPDDYISCPVKAYLILFFNIATFAWVNVMSVDIWWTFGSPKCIIGQDQRKQDLKKFLMYFAYGWGWPLCHILIIWTFAGTRVLPDAIQPYVGDLQCFIEKRNYSRVLFLDVPGMLFQLFNTVLFIKTIRYCIKVKNEIRRMNDTTRSGALKADKGRLALAVKLAIIMGIIWILEVVTAFLDMKNRGWFLEHLEVVIDNIICLQGLFIFLIFICKKTIHTKLKRKLKILNTRRRTSSSISMTQSQTISGYYPMNKKQTTMSITDNKM